MYCLATRKVGMWSRNGSCKTSKAGTGKCLSEQAVLEADFADRFRTARGFGFGFDDLSRKESRIPRNVRKKMTAAVVAVMKSRCLVGMSFLSKTLLVLIQPVVNGLPVPAARGRPALRDSRSPSRSEGKGCRVDYFPRRELLNAGLGAAPAAPGRPCCGRPAGLLPGWSLLNGLIDPTELFLASAGFR